MANLIITEVQELKKLIKDVLLEVEIEKEKASTAQKLYTRNQIAKRLGKAHPTITKLIAAGYIETTANGLITEEAIEKFLKNR